MNYLTKFFVFLSLTALMLLVCVEAIKTSRDQLRLINSRSLSKSIQHYHTLNGVYPESNIDNNISELLFAEGLISKPVRDPAYTSATLSVNHYYYILINFYNTAKQSLSDFDSKQIKESIKTKISYYLNLNSDGEIAVAPSSDQNRKQGLENWVDSSKVSHIPDNKHGVSNNFLDSNGIPLECFIAYKADNKTNSYEISVYLESRFFKEKMKWDGGNDTNRFEIGNDLRLNTELVVVDGDISVLSENVSIIK